MTPVVYRMRREGARTVSISVRGKGTRAARARQGGAKTTDGRAQHAAGMGNVDAGVGVGVGAGAGAGAGWSWLLLAVQV